MTSVHSTTLTLGVQEHLAPLDKLEQMESDTRSSTNGESSMSLLSLPNITSIAAQVSSTRNTSTRLQQQQQQVLADNEEEITSNQREDSLGLDDIISNRLLEYGIVQLKPEGEIEAVEGVSSSCAGNWGSSICCCCHCSSNTLPQHDTLQDSISYSGQQNPNHASTSCKYSSCSTASCSSLNTSPSKSNSFNAHANMCRSESDITSTSTVTSIQYMVEEIHRWLFVEGGYFDNVEALMSNYCVLLRTKYSIPIDRLYYGGVGLHPKLTAYLWKWEYNEEFVFREMPEHIFKNRNELFSPDEPFCVLEQGRAKFVRIKSSSPNIPPDVSKWFVPQKYTDYYALPDIHRNQSKGGIAWATKNIEGFHPHHIEVFQSTMKALTTVMRLHTNDMVLNTLTSRYEQEIQDRTIELEIANKRLETQFHKQLEHFACMSHEFRTPLSAILGLSSLLLMENSEDEEEKVNEDDFQQENQQLQQSILPQHVIESIRMIHTSADLLRSVVNDVLDYSSMQNDETQAGSSSGSGNGKGVFQVDIVPNVNLHTLLKDVVTTMQQSSKAKERSITISSNRLAETPIPRFVTTDPRRLQQILFNLLGNACKFSKVGGTVELNVSMKDRREHCEEQNAETASMGGNNTLLLSVKDYGKGIHTKDFKDIFEPFNQASKETQTIYGGTGLGLAITSKLVKGLGGTITVDSVINEYAEFIIELPLISTIDIVNKSNKSGKHGSDGGGDECKCIDPSISQTMSRTPDTNTTTQSVLPMDGNTASIATSSASTTVREQKTHPRDGPTFIPLSDNEKSKPLPERPPSSRSTISSVSSVHSSSATSFPFENVKVLVADDNKINQKVLQRMLFKVGISKDNLDIVDNGLKAVEICSSTDYQYDIVFMDIQMPVMDGLQATKEIKEKERSNYHVDETNPQTATKIVFCTAHAVDNYRVEAQEAGGDGFISKPYRLNDIRESIVDNVAIKSSYISTTDSR